MRLLKILKTKEALPWLAKRNAVPKSVEQVKRKNNMEVSIMEEKQIIEVEYDSELVNKYKNEYIMEEEGTGADPDAEPSDTQSTFNEETLEEMNEAGEVVFDD